MIDLYAAPTSNGMRARIALEECGLSYKLHPIDIPKGEHKTPQFLAMNPMGQIPVLVDSEGPGGKPLTPIPPMMLPPAMIATPPTAYVTFGSGVCGTVVGAALPMRSATAFVLSSLRASVSEADA